MKVGKPSKSDIITAILATALVITLLSVLQSGGKNEACGLSEYNIYSNRTYGYTYFAGNCYVKAVVGVSESHVSCRGGFFGIGQSCFETKEPTYSLIETTVCYKLKNGERC